MKTFHLLAASSLLTALAFACADNSETDTGPTDNAAIPPADSGVSGDGSVDGGENQPDADCSDCAWFPTSCTKGSLCNVTVAAFDPRAILFGFDIHGEDVTAVGSYGSVVTLGSGAWTRSNIGTPDALHGVTTHDGSLWVAGSINSVFVRETSGGQTVWTEHAPGGPNYWQPRNWPVNALFSEPTGTWVWAATGTTCAPQAGTDGVGLVRVRKQPDWLELQTIIQFQAPMSQCISMNALDGTSGALWVAGEKGMLYQTTNLEGDTPTPTPVDSGTTSTLLGVWAEPSGHVFVVGKDGTVLHRAPGGAFAALGEGVPKVAYHAVRGTSANDVWIAGEDATVMHWDGQHWARVAIAGVGDKRPTLRAIAAVASDRVWVAGDNVLLGLAKEDGRAP